MGKEDPHYIKDLVNLSLPDNLCSSEATLDIDFNLLSYRGIGKYKSFTLSKRAKCSLEKVPDLIKCELITVSTLPLFKRVQHD